MIRTSVSLVIAIAAASIVACGPAHSRASTAPQSVAAARMPAPPPNVPRHVLTSDYVGGQAGTHTVPASQLAPWLSWAEVSRWDKTTGASGIKTMIYTDPNRQIADESLYTSDESTFAHDCSGNRVYRNYPRSGGRFSQQFLMNPASPGLLQVWRSYVDKVMARGHFDAVFEDDADNLVSMSLPCKFDEDSWLRASIDGIRKLGYPVVYNGLSAYQTGWRVSKSIGLNAAAIGGMLEDCYAQRGKTPTGARWRVQQETELAMADDRKLFFCYGNDTSDAASSLDARLYEFASFLLTYDPSTSILWEYWATPSRSHVMPESQFVPLQPVRGAASIDQLQVSPDLYERGYYRCYLGGKYTGACAVYVNSGGSTVALPASARHYAHTLLLSGSGLFDGGTAGPAGPAPPQSLGPASAVIAIQ